MKSVRVPFGVIVYSRTHEATRIIKPFQPSLASGALIAKIIAAENVSRSSDLSKEKTHSCAETEARESSAAPLQLAARWSSRRKMSRKFMRPFIEISK